LNEALYVHIESFICSTMWMVGPPESASDPSFTGSLSKIEVIFLGALLSYKPDAPALRVEEA
ncbi:MAG TPA: hypothetical protein VFV92_08565, partial [Candidatus Bathyarchaeia archaeon]|nr:hypothetical protein [Candidatus Bathyarchaeia archaeon]